MNARDFRTALSVEQEVIAIWEKKGKAVTRLPIECRHWDRIATSCWDTRKGSVSAWRKKNHASGTPCPASAFDAGCQRARRATAEIQEFQLVTGKEGH